MFQRTPNRDGTRNTNMLRHARLDSVAGFSGGTPSPQRNDSLSYLSPLPVCSPSPCPSVLSSFDPSLARPLRFMAVQSQIRSPVCVSWKCWSLLVFGSPRAQINHCAFIKRRSATSSSPSRSRHNPISRPALTSGSGYHPRASDIASASASVHHSHQTPRSSVSGALASPIRILQP